MNEAWSRTIVRICGVKVSVIGQPRLTGPSLWVSNHVSWLDIFILSGVRSVLFVAKAEIRDWPVLGWLVARVGAIFLNRNQRHSLKQVGLEMQERFQRQEVIGLFAEGTTSDGFDVLPFRSSLFDPAIKAGLDIQPVALRFFYKGQRSDYAAFVGDETLVGNLWVLLRSTGISAEIEFLPMVSAERAAELGRAKIARHLQDAIGAAVRLSDVESVASVLPNGNKQCERDKHNLRQLSEGD